MLFCVLISEEIKNESYMFCNLHDTNLSVLSGGLVYIVTTCDLILITFCLPGCSF